VDINLLVLPCYRMEQGQYGTNVSAGILKLAQKDVKIRARTIVAENLGSNPDVLGAREATRKICPHGGGKVTKGRRGAYSPRVSKGN